jgi:hypothetical protein
MSYYNIKTDEPVKSVTIGQYWPDVIAQVHNRYTVVSWIDLLFDQLDGHLDMLYSILVPFSGKMFSPSERIVISHRDSDYYTSPTAFGNTLWNLYRIYARLDIPTEYTIVLTNQPTLQNELDRLAIEFNLPAMRAVYCPYVWCPGVVDVDPIGLNIEQINYPFISLNGKDKTYRMYALCRMHDLEILNAGITSLWISDLPSQEIPPPDYSSITPVPMPPGFHLRTTYPYTRVNDEIIFDETQRELYHRCSPSLRESHSHPLIQGQPSDPVSRFQPMFAQHALWHIVNETVGDYPHPLITEKTFKAILTKRPFIMLGAPGTLKMLQDLGFLTFDLWINEKYDRLPTIADRIDCVTHQLENICAMSQSELQQVGYEMTETLEYNFNHYIEVFGKTNLSNFLENVL